MFGFTIDSPWERIAYDDSIWDMLFKRAVHHSDSLHCTEWRYTDTHGVVWRLIEGESVGDWTNTYRSIEYRKASE